MNKWLKVGLSMAAAFGAGYLIYEGYKLWKDIPRKNDETIYGADLVDELPEIETPGVKEIESFDEDEDDYNDRYDSFYYGRHRETYWDPETGEEEVSRELKYPANSREALNQWIDICMIDYDPNVSGYELLNNLWTVLYVPKDGHQDTFGLNARDMRDNFFGEESSNSQDITWGDVMIYILSKLQEELEVSPDRALQLVLGKFEGYFRDPYAWAMGIVQGDIGMFDLIEYHIAFDGSLFNQMNGYILWYLENREEY